MKWVLTPDEFTHVWANETGLERRPYPINLVQANTVRTENDYTALRLPQRFGKHADPELTAALTLCTRRDATALTVSGVRAPRAPHTEQDERTLAFAAAIDNHAAILIATPDFVTVLMVHTRALGEHLVAIIGSAPAGRLAPMREPQEAVLGPDRAPAPVADPPAGADHFRHTLCQPVDGRGFITVTVDPDNPVSPATRHRTWLDFTGDGRYLLTTAQEMALTPISDTDFAAELLRLAHIR
ncbi:ESX secretion-associated protein EspG [Nocardia panacis]|uniref:ESX secretion-associated protein EspG n=1 Tax=Nocardia panacis TaxID=2340916 RepID=A0A3A4KPV0_9NOCA|nr:ESX secretion-associated protein EspG [Nocardia panacis]RJO76592.1 ESX secretion-associated protein EspG [Nocardia panacis]